jgi:hypothetical protein
MFFYVTDLKTVSLIFVEPSGASESLQDVMVQAKSPAIYRKLSLLASSIKRLCIPCPPPPKIGLVTSIE